MSNCVMQGSLLQAGCLSVSGCESDCLLLLSPTSGVSYKSLKTVDFSQASSQPARGFQHFKRPNFLFQERARTWLPRHSPVITLHALHKSCKICPWLHGKSLFCLLPQEDNNFRRKKKSFLKNVRKSGLI